VSREYVSREYVSREYVSREYMRSPDLPARPTASVGLVDRAMNHWNYEMLE